jgi:hypothetical protein
VGRHGVPDLAARGCARKRQAVEVTLFDTRTGAVEALATLSGEPILVPAATFHPELSPDRAVHAMAFGEAGPSTAATGP